MKRGARLRRYGHLRRAQPAKQSLGSDQTPGKLDGDPAPKLGMEFRDFRELLPREMCHDGRVRCDDGSGAAIERFQQADFSHVHPGAALGDLASVHENRNAARENKTEIASSLALGKERFARRVLRYARRRGNPVGDVGMAIDDELTAQCIEQRGATVLTLKTFEHDVSFRAPLMA